MDKKEKFIDYYEVLGVWPTADEDAIKKTYFKLAKMHHPDVAAKTGTGDDVDGGVDFKLINEAFSVLSDKVKRSEFDQQLKKKTGGVSERSDADRRSAQLAFEQARTAMKHNRYDKAVVLLKSAIKYDDSNPAYHSWYGLSLGVLKTHLHEARDACKRALDMEFYNADFHANLGFVYHQAGLTSTAEESFAEALKWDPEHSVALKYSGGKKGGKIGKTGSGNGGKGLSGIFSMFRRSKKDKPERQKAPPRRPAAKKARSG